MLSARPLALDGELYHVKTPARAARDRNLLQENLHRMPMTVNGKGKALQTPRRAMTVRTYFCSVCLHLRLDIDDPWQSPTRL